MNKRCHLIVFLIIIGNFTLYNKSKNDSAIKLPNSSISDEGATIIAEFTNNDSDESEKASLWMLCL